MWAAPGYMTESRHANTPYISPNHSHSSFLSYDWASSRLSLGTPRPMCRDVPDVDQCSADIPDLHGKRRSCSQKHHLRVLVHHRWNQNQSSQHTPSTPSARLQSDLIRQHTSDTWALVSLITQNKGKEYCVVQTHTVTHVATHRTRGKDTV